MRIVVTTPSEQNEVDQVRNMVDSSAQSNQAHNNVVDPAKSSAMKSPALAEDIQDEDEAVKAEKWIGVVVHKDFADGRGYMGRVLKFNAETKLFEVYFENHITEYVGLEELQKIVAPRGMISRHLDCDVRIDPSETAARNKRQLGGGEAVPVHPRYVTPSSREQGQSQPKKRRVRKAAAPSTYVPLAFRETKKDEYYYY